MNRFVVIAGYVLLAVVILWGVGQGYRDSYWVTGLLFYVPTPIVVAACLFVLLIAVWRRCWQTALVAVMLAVPPMFMLGWIENRLFNAPSSYGDNPSANTDVRKLTLIHWNIKGAKPDGDTSGARRLLSELDADIFVLSDAPWVTRRLTLKNMSTLQLGRMAVYAAGEIRVLEDLSQGPLKSYLLSWQSPGGQLKILLGDITSSLAIHRAPYLSMLTNSLYGYRADLLVGDLNAPRRSQALAELQPGYRHAYDEAGSGWSYTWPWPIPVYAIDNCIVGPKIKIYQYKTISSSYSDHKLQWLSFSVTDS